MDPVSGGVASSQGDGGQSDRPSLARRARPRGSRAPRLVGRCTKQEVGQARSSRAFSPAAVQSVPRALARGLEQGRAIWRHMSYLPPDEVEEALRVGAVHPWTMAFQGKWRACQDYSGITNRAAVSAPFGLPVTWDVKKVIIPGKTHFAKYDLRDGFWAVPVHPDSRRCLMMRHPATGRLMRCDRLPFGFLDSPRVFCSVTEAMAQVFRERVAGRGMHIWCYVDDYLLAGDTESLAREAGAIFEQVLLEFGFVFAPHKQRGPCRCIEFLGLLIVNTDEDWDASGVFLEPARRADARADLSARAVCCSPLQCYKIISTTYSPRSIRASASRVRLAAKGCVLR